SFARRSSRGSRQLNEPAFTLARSTTDCVRGQVAAAHSLSNCQSLTWKSCRESDQSKRKRRPAPSAGASSVLARRAASAVGGQFLAVAPTRRAPVRRRATQ